MIRSKDLVGKKIACLLILGTEKKGKCWYLKYRCDCGKIGAANASNIKRGLTRSCGCMQISTSVQKRTKHGRCETSEYRAWRKMKERCYDPKNVRYEHYMKKGIIVCDHWLHSFENFFADMGERPSANHSIGRIHNDKNYEPSNCEWQTREQQANNMSNNRFETYNGETLTVAQWARRFDIPYRWLINKMYKPGMTIEKALARYEQFRLSRSSPV